MPSLEMQDGDGSESGFAGRVARVARAQLDSAQEAASTLLQWYSSQLVLVRLLLNAVVAIGLVAAVLAVVYHKTIIHFLVILSNSWYDLRYGRLVLFMLVFGVSFPPLLGFSALSMLSGMVYGFPGGWPLLASALILGSFCSFLLFRYVLHEQAVQLANRHAKFRALAEILSENNSLVLLVLIRLCPLPYSLSNGALAAVPELPATTYLMASIITSPKLAGHIFVGHKIKNLDKDTTMSSKIVDIVSIVITIVATTATTFVIYKRMQRKLDEYSVVSNHPNNQHIIFGNFDGDLDSVELDTSNVDDFIIEEEE